MKLYNYGSRNIFDSWTFFIDLNKIDNLSLVPSCSSILSHKFELGINSDILQICYSVCKPLSSLESLFSDLEELW